MKPLSPATAYPNVVGNFVENFVGFGPLLDQLSDQDLKRRSSDKPYLIFP